MQLMTEEFNLDAAMYVLIDSRHSSMEGHFGIPFTWLAASLFVAVFEGLHDREVVVGRK